PRRKRGRIYGTGYLVLATRNGRSDVRFLPRRFLDIDGNLHLVFASARDDAAQRADVAVVATAGDGDVFSGGYEIIGRVEAHPAEIAAIHGEPGVRGVRAHQSFLALRRARAQVAAHIARRQTERAQTGDGHVREVLAD